MQECKGGRLYGALCEFQFRLGRLIIGPSHTDHPICTHRPHNPGQRRHFTGAHVPESPKYLRELYGFLPFMGVRGPPKVVDM